MNCENKNIVLIGMMGSGKTTVGKLLAEAIGLTFVDTDQLLENKTERKITEIFAQDGEQKFRTLEAEVIDEVTDKVGQVIATGGGVVLREENIKKLGKKGTIIFLHASPETLMERLRDDETRPLLQCQEPENKLKEILKFRLPFYRKASRLEIDTNSMKPEEIVHKLIY